MGGGILQYLGKCYLLMGRLTLVSNKHNGTNLRRKKYPTNNNTERDIKIGIYLGPNSPAFL